MKGLSYSPVFEVWTTDYGISRVNSAPIKVSNLHAHIFVLLFKLKYLNMELQKYIIIIFLLHEYRKKTLQGLDDPKNGTIP